MAHSKLSNVWVRPAIITSKLLSYSFPQTSHCAIWVLQKSYSSIRLVRLDSPPQLAGSPNSRSEALQLHDLAVIHEQIHVGPVILHIPAESRRIGRLEHYFFQAQF